MTSRHCWMNTRLISCCAFFFSVPYPLHLKVVDALGHHVSPSDMVGSKGLQSTGWNEADLEGLLEHIFPSFIRSPRAASSLLKSPIEDHTGEVCWSPYKQYGQPSEMFGRPSWMQHTLTPHIQGFQHGGYNLPN